MLLEQPRDTPTHDAALLERLRAGEPAAFEEMVRAFAGRMLAAARRILGNEQDACDAVQDAFLSAFKSLDRFEGNAQLGTWLQRIAVNAALSRLRSRRREAERAIEELLPRYTADGHQAEPASEWQERPKKAVEREETRRLVREFIDQLPESYRAVLVLRDIEGCDTEATAQLLGLNATLVKTRLHRARQALRGLLDPLVRGGQL